MKRRLGAGAAMVAAVTMAVAGCSAGTDTAAKPDKASRTHADRQDAGTLLPQSYKRIKQESFRFRTTMTMGEAKIVSTGVYDMARSVGKADVSLKGHDVELRVFDSDVYVHMVGRWMHVKTDKMTYGHMFADAANPVANADYLLAVSDDVEKVGDGRYKGTLNLKRYADKYADPKDAKAVKELLSDLGPGASKVPFEATVDEQDRLTGLKTTMTITKHGEKTTIVQDSTYSDFGTKVDVAKPPADKIVDAPSGLYRD